VNGNSQEELSKTGTLGNSAAESAVPTETEKWLVIKLLDVMGRPSVGVKLWDGQRLTAPGSERKPDAFLCLHDRRALYRLLYKPTRTFGELYTSGRLTVQGDLVKTLEILYAALAANEPKPSGTRRLAQRLVGKRARPNTLEGSRRNIHSHYDLGNEFYELVARPRLHPVHLRLLPEPGGHPGAGTGGEARTGLPQAASAAR
jgi:hypothetical protein